MNFSIVLQTARVSPAEVDTMAAAIQLQLRQDVCPPWGIDPNEIRVTRASAVLPPDAIPVILLDVANPEEYGDHTLGASSQIFVGGIMAAGGQVLTGDYAVSQVVSHELIEAMIDPRASNVDALGYAFEACDPVQSNWYEVNGVAVSDFVYPCWFEAEATSGHPMDHCDKVESNHVLASGGYCVRTGPEGQHLTFGERPPPMWRVTLASRRIRKRLRRDLLPPEIPPGVPS